MLCTVDAAGLESRQPIHFVNDVVPLLSRLGSNSGGCHGKASGQNGFKLSVFAFDPVADYESIVRESRGRRLFPAAPAQSLLLRKVSGQAAHGGGPRISQGSLDHELLLNWVRQGAPWGDPKAPKVASIRVEPSQRVLVSSARQQLLVTATFTYDTIRDVTSSAVYTSNADQIAVVDRQGMVLTGESAGEAAITINYMGHVVASRIIMPLANQEEWLQPPVHNQIDRLVWNKLAVLGIVPTSLCDDATFLRRVYINTIGCLPTADEVRRFVADRSDVRRSRLIDEVLRRPEFADYQAGKWADILLVDRKALGDRGAWEFRRWLRAQIAGNRPYDEWVQEILTASGNSARFGPVNFYRAARTPGGLTRSVSQDFLGIRLDCAQCHHHPFDRWGQQDFYGLAGFFTGLRRQSLATDRELVFYDRFQPATGEAVPVRLPGGSAVDLHVDEDPRLVLADWVTAPENPWFARLVANRIRKQLLGRGLVEPEDDLRKTNPAINEPLLDYLTTAVVDYDFDLKAVIRLILNSRVYQLFSETYRTQPGQTRNFACYPVRRLPADVLLDAVGTITGVPESFPGLPSGTRAVELWDNRLPSYFSGYLRTIDTRVGLRMRPIR